MDLQNANLRTLAVVEAQMTKGLSRPTEYLIPLFQAFITRNAGKPFSTKDAIDHIKTTYDIEVPVYLAESLLPALINLGSITEEKHLGCYICQKSIEINSPNDLNEIHFTLLEERLRVFSSKHEIENPLSCETWQQAMINFFSNKESKNKYVKIKNKVISNPKERDDWIISKFIFESKALDQDIFSLIKRIYAGFAIADTISAIQNIGHTEDWNELSVVYDSTVLMRILGTSGEILKQATLELHNLLLEIGCKTYYFDHNLNELFHNLEALTQRHQAGESIHRETAQALEHGEITIGQINLLRGSADTKLGHLNITQIEIPSRLTSTKSQINPVELEDYLNSNIYYKNNSYAAQVDAESIEKIIFLRADKKFTDLPKSKFIFVTHNNNYARISSRYCQERLGYHHHHAPPIITLSTLTRMAWLASDHGGEHIRGITKELIINCFQASLPDAKWFTKFWSAIENTAPELLDTNTHDSLYLLDIRKSAEDISLGSSALLDDIDIPKILERAKENAKSKDRQHEELIEQEKQKAEVSYNNYLNEKERIKEESENKIKANDLESLNQITTISNKHKATLTNLISQTNTTIAILKQQQIICCNSAKRKTLHLKIFITLLAAAYLVFSAYLTYLLGTEKIRNYIPIATLLAPVFFYIYTLWKGEPFDSKKILERKHEKYLALEYKNIGLNESDIEKLEAQLVNQERELQELE